MGFCKVLTKDSWVTTMILHRKFLTKSSCVSEKVLKRGELGIYRSIKKGNLSICKVLTHNSWASEKTVANLQSLTKYRWASDKLLTGTSKAFVKF